MMMLRTACAVLVLLAVVLALGGQAQASEEKTMKIRCTVGDTVLTATLDDNATARDFVAMLPMTLAMSDYAGTEKVTGKLFKGLSTSGAPAGYDPSVGDITLYAPWGNLALFYKDFHYADGLVRMGEFDGDGMEVLGNISGDFEMRVERID